MAAVVHKTDVLQSKAPLGSDLSSVVPGHVFRHRDRNQISRRLHTSPHAAA